MSGEKYPNISAVFGILDSALGCVFGLLQLAGLLSLIVIIVGFLVELFQ